MVDSTETDTTLNNSDTTNNTDALIIDSAGNIYDTVTNPVTGRTWLDRNLGALKVATSSTDTAAFGYYFQWGRGSDGHQLKNSDTTHNTSTLDNPGHGYWIRNGYPPFDWRIPQNDSLWQGVEGINNPCPNGFRLPTKSEWQEEVSTWVSDDLNGAFDSPLKLPAAGLRQIHDGSISSVGSSTFYWSSSVESDDIIGSVSSYIRCLRSSSFMGIGERAAGIPVRCIQD